MDISRTIEADSTQVNADDLTEEPRVVTITAVTKGTADQPVNIELAEFPGRAYRPCKSMRRVIVAAWGPDASTYIGRKLAIYNDREVRWGGQAVGGVRIKAMSHLDKPLTLPLTVTRGKRAPYSVQPLPSEPVRISAEDLSRLNKMLTDTGLIEDRAQALALISKAAGRTITTTKELTPAEAQAVFTAIQQETDQ